MAPASFPPSDDPPRPDAGTAPEPRAQVPRSVDEIASAAARAGIVIPEACLPGVAANLALLAGHLERLRAA